MIMQQRRRHIQKVEVVTLLGTPINVKEEREESYSFKNLLRDNSPAPRPRKESQPHILERNEKAKHQPKTNSRHNLFLDSSTDSELSNNCTNKYSKPVVNTPTAADSKGVLVKVIRKPPVVKYVRKNSVENFETNIKKESSKDWLENLPQNLFKSVDESDNNPRKLSKSKHSHSLIQNADSIKRSISAKPTSKSINQTSIADHSTAEKEKKEKQRERSKSKGKMSLGLRRASSVMTGTDDIKKKRKASVQVEDEKKSKCYRDWLLSDPITKKLFEMLIKP